MNNKPICVHSKNNKIFEFRGKPTVLICATEHYGSVINRGFNFEKYLVEAADKSQNYSRLFGLFREEQTPINPYSPCKPESTDFVTPFRRVGPKRAIDGLGQYDLDSWNQEYFERLERYMNLASEYGIVIELTLFSNSYSPGVWGLNPLNPANNINHIGQTSFENYLSRKNTRLYDYQCRYAKKIVEVTNKFDNLIYEICNEPGSEASMIDGAASIEQVNEWMCSIAKLIRETEVTLPNKHIISGSQSWNMIGCKYIERHYEDAVVQPADHSFGEFPVDVVCIHPLPCSQLGEKNYNLGSFMLKELALEGLRKYCLDSYDRPKPLIMDEDNVATRFRDYEAWTIHRKRAWMTALCGGHYNFIDFSIMNYCEAGTDLSRKYIRSWMKYLTEFVHSIDLIKARPVRDFLSVKPDSVLDAVLAVKDSDYCIYLADMRELPEYLEAEGRPPQTGYDLPINGQIHFEIPEGRYLMKSFGPKSGLYSPAIETNGGKVCLDVPEFNDDLIIRLTRK